MFSTIVIYLLIVLGLLGVIAVLATRLAKLRIAYDLRLLDLEDAADEIDTANRAYALLEGERNACDTKCHMLERLHEVAGATVRNLTASVEALNDEIEKFQMEQLRTMLDGVYLDEATAKDELQPLLFSD